MQSDINISYLLTHRNRFYEGDRRECRNCKGITLLCTVVKMFEGVERQSGDMAECKLDEVQGEKKICMIMCTPVSYTHLDVYKRQYLHWM